MVAWFPHLQVLNTILAFPFQYFTRDRQKPSVVDIDTVKLPKGSDKSLDDYLKVRSISNSACLLGWW